MAQVIYETCPCGAEFRYAGNFPAGFVAEFEKKHAPCREKYVKEVKTCEPSPGVTVTHGG